MNWDAVIQALEFAFKRMPGMKSSDGSAIRTMIEALKEGRVTIVAKPE